MSKGRVTSILLAAALPSMTHALPTRIVVTSKDAAPDTPADTRFSAFPLPASINASDQIAFQSLVQGPNIAFDNTGVWTASGTNLAKIFRMGEQAPGTPMGVVFDSGPSLKPIINNAGQVSFQTNLKGAAGTNTAGIFSTAPGALAKVARLGDPAPGLADHFYSGFGIGTSASVFSHNGVTAAQISTREPSLSTRFGVWAGQADPIAKIARETEPAPGLPGVTFSGGTAPVINASGKLAFSHQLSGAVSGSNNRSLWIGDAAGLTLAARTAQPAPDTGGVFAIFDPPDINAAGELAFGAGISGPGISTANDRGIWAGAPGQMRKIIRKGEPAPGIPGATYDLTFPTSILINDQSTLAFAARIAGTGVDTSNFNVLYTGSSAASLKLVARSGDQAPGAPAGAKLSVISTFTSLLNNKGQVAFAASLTDGTQGIFAWDPLDGLRKVARSGEPFEVAPGVFRDFGFFSNPIHTNASTGDGRPTSLSDTGHLAFTATWNDPASGSVSAILLADINAPIPGDATRNGIVDHHDFAVLHAHFGQAGTFDDGDFNRDGFINFTDFQILERNFGMSSDFLAPAPALLTNVPEPAALMWFVTSIALLRRRRTS